MNKRQRQKRNRAEREAHNLQWNSLDGIDKIAMCVAVIKQRDWLFDSAEEYRIKGDPKNALQKEYIASKYNTILLKLGHPAAIQTHNLHLPKIIKINGPISEKELAKNTIDVLSIIEDGNKDDA